MKKGMVECSACRLNLVSPSSKAKSRAYNNYKIKVPSKQRALNVLLVVGDCILVGLQPLLVYMSKVDGKFNFSPISVNFLTEIAKVIFAIVMLLLQARHQKVGEKPLLSLSTFVQAARNNVLLAVPAGLYAINNYLKFIMQLYFNPVTVKMLSNLKVLVFAVLLKTIMKQRFPSYRDLSNNNFSGTIPLTLGDLEHLLIRNLSKNHLNGALPVEFGNLRSIQIM